MTEGETPLLEDPMFQLNFTLWMLQPFPGSATIRAVLREAGYLLDSMSRDLSVPLDIRAALTELVGSATAPAPDVLAQGREGTHWLVIECKGRSFGSDSSNAAQGKKVLAAASNLTDALALPADRQRPAHVAYLTSLDHSDSLANTLQQLREELKATRIPAATASTFGLSRQKDGVYVQRSLVGDWPPTLAQILPGATRVIEVDEEDDPRPLYLIPWDPSVSQDKAMRDYCRDIFFARVATEAGSVLGRTELPARLTLLMEQLVAEATFGVSRSWRSKGDLAKILLEGKRFLGVALGSLKERLTVAMPSGPERLELTLQTPDDQKAAIEALLVADPTDIVSADDDNQPSLFDSLE